MYPLNFNVRNTICFTTEIFTFSSKLVPRDIFIAFSARVMFPLRYFRKLWDAINVYLYFCNPNEHRYFIAFAENYNHLTQCSWHNKTSFMAFVRKTSHRIWWALTCKLKVINYSFHRLILRADDFKMAYMHSYQ